MVFAIGCSFSFEDMLAREGIGLRHVEEGRNVPMYRTSIPNRRAGSSAASSSCRCGRCAAPTRFGRCRSPAGFRAHGAPIHLGDPRELGISDLNAPEFGDAVTIRDGELPVFGRAA